MIFILVPANGADVRVFQTYSALEQVMKRGTDKCISENCPINWCYAIEYTGVDELLSTFAYYINEVGDVVRESIR